MAVLGATFRDELMKAVFNGQPFTFPENFYLALFLSDPTPDLTGIEVSGQPYQRLQITSFTMPVNGEVSNASMLAFPVADEDWGTITHYGIFDAQTGGKLIAFGAFDIAKVIFRGDQYIVNPGGLRIKLE